MQCSTHLPKHRKNRVGDEECSWKIYTSFHPRRYLLFHKKYFICKTLNQNTLRQLFKMFMTRMEENSRKHYKSGPTTSSSKGLFFNLTTQTLYDIFPRDEKHKSKHFLVPFHSAGWKISMTKVFLNSSDASLYEESSMKLVTRGEWRDSELFISFVSMIRLRHTWAMSSRKPSKPPLDDVYRRSP